MSISFDILITGSRGFLGSQLTLFLKKRGYRVFSVSKFPIDSDPLPEDTYNVDILDIPQLEACFKLIFEKAKNPLILFHFAALSHVNVCQKNPSLSFDLNVVSLERILQFSINYGISKIIFPSSALVYDFSNTLPISEHGRLHTNNIYATHKMMCETNIQGSTQSTSLKGVILRLANIYGEGGNSDTVINLILTQLYKQGGSITLRNTTSIRDYLYIQDAIEAMAKFIEIESDRSCEIFNLSSNIQTSVQDIIEACYQVTGIYKPVVVTEENDGNNLSKIYFDSQRLRDTISWKPSYPLEYGLKQVAKYIRQD